MKLLVTGGAGFIGSHIVQELLKERVGEVRVFDNFTRGRLENLEGSLNDPRCNVFQTIECKCICWDSVRRGRLRMGYIQQ